MENLRAYYTPDLTKPQEKARMVTIRAFIPPMPGNWYATAVIEEDDGGQLQQVHIHNLKVWRKPTPKED